MMRHPADGTLRRLLDEPFSVAIREREHVAGCARCQARLEEAGADARRVAATLTAPPLELDLGAALAVQRSLPLADASVGTDGGLDALRARLTSAWRRPLRVAAAVGAAALLVAALAGTGAAEALLTIFQPQQVAPVAVNPGDMSALPDLSAYGSLEWTARPSERTVAGLAAAEAEAGQHVLTLTAVPDGVASTPTVHLFPASAGTFTFDPTRAAGAAAAAGATIPPMPADIAGSTLYGSVGPGVLQVFHATGSLGQGASSLGGAALPALVLGQTRAPSVSTTGVTFDQLRDYLLAQPGISPSLAAQLRSLGDPTRTLPIPVPAGETVTSSVTVRGVKGVWIGMRDGLGGGVVWQEGSTIYGVAGMFDQQRIVAIADALR